MEGQWIGNVNGDNYGTLIANIERVNGKLTGHAILWEVDAEIPSVVCDLKVLKNKDEITLSGDNVQALNPKTGHPIPEQDIKKIYPDGHISSYIKAKGHLQEDEITITGEYTTDKDIEGELTLYKATKLASLTESKKVSWNEFKIEALDVPEGNTIFRGQSDNRWLLRTSFHRFNRVNLHKYFKEDIPKLYRQIHAMTGMKFDLSNNEDLNTLLYLAQHHGYPTPLLDWSLSPFVAAYFAFIGCHDSDESNANQPSHVRIFALNKKKWQKDTLQAEHFDTYALTISYIESLASGNKRAIPQQAVSTFSNIDFIEAYLNKMHPHNAGQYLTAYDIPIKEKHTALKELRLMGIHTATLFPDLDGLCKHLKETDF